MAVQDFLDLLARERCTAILRTPEEAKAAPAMQAALDGGFRVCEFTLTIPGALERIAEFSKRDGIMVGNLDLSLNRGVAIGEDELSLKFE